MTTSTALLALTGGLLIGSSAVLLFWLNGRLAAASGIAAGAIVGPRGDRTWRWLFLAGMVGGVFLYRVLATETFVPREGFSPWLLIGAGVLIGIGTRMGSGCTSGHGVCGIARLSPRSIVATGIFMATAVITVWFARHVWGVV